MVENFLCWCQRIVCSVCDHLVTDGRVDVKAEMCLGRCAALLAVWVDGSKEPLRMFFLTSLLRRALSQVLT